MLIDQMSRVEYMGLCCLVKCLLWDAIQWFKIDLAETEAQNS